MSIFTCGLHAFTRKRDDREWKKMSSKDRKKITDKLQLLADSWTNSQNPDFRNVKDAKWNNFETFNWLWEKYTHKPLNPAEFPINFKDLRKFEMGLRYYNEKITSPRGLFASKFHLPRAAMQSVPELKKFEMELLNETSFFRDYSNETNRQVNDFLDGFKKFSLEEGGESTSLSRLNWQGRKEIRALQDEFDILRKKFLSSRDPKEKETTSQALRDNRNRIREFYNKGSGQALKILNSVLQGADIESIKRDDGSSLSNVQKTRLNKMLDNYQLIRKSGSKGLIRGLQKIKSLAKDKNLEWVDSTVDRINKLIKAIEFQHTVDENGATIDYKHMQSERDFLEFGFKADERYTKNGQVKFSPHYMSQYTLGMLDIINKIDTHISENKLSLDDKIRTEIESYESIVNVAKGRSPIANPVYDNDPYFFLKKYTSDVGVFNYKLHVKSTFKKAVDAITNEHLKPAEEKGRQDLVETAQDMKKLLDDVYSEIQHMDPNLDKNVSDLARIMTSVTYFRLMGGNVRSAARNATQRLWEFVEFGVRAAAPGIGQAAKWYSQSGGATTNNDKLTRQLKRFGLQWFDGKSKKSNALDILKGEKVDSKVSQTTRGAIEDSYMLDKSLYVDADGSLAIRGGDRPLESVARFSANIAGYSGKLHKIVEDWNRSKTFKIGFSLAHQNLQSMNKTYLTQKILGEKGIAKIKSIKGDDYVVTYKDLQAKHGGDAQSIIDAWIENTAGQMAYNSALDLHFEYAKWNKAKAIKATSENSKAAGLAKMGLGQFAHYRFNMINLIHKWAREAGISIKAGDVRSEEFIRPLRYAFVQSMLLTATIAGRTNFVKLAPEETRQFAETVWTWLTTDRDDPEQLKKLDKATYGQGGFYFLGPNVNYALSAAEFFGFADMFENKNDDMQLGHQESVKKAFKPDENKVLYDKIALINSQMARTFAYTGALWQGGGSIKDAIYLELGLFPDKEQKEWSKWLYGTGKKRRKKTIRKSASNYDRQAALKALSGM